MLGAAATAGAIGLDAGVFKGLAGAGATTGSRRRRGSAGAGALAPLLPAQRAPLPPAPRATGGAGVSTGGAPQQREV